MGQAVGRAQDDPEGRRLGRGAGRTRQGRARCMSDREARHRDCICERVILPTVRGCPVTHWAVSS